MAAMERSPHRDTLTDEDLIRMVRDGDADAFDVLFVRHHIGVYNFAYTMLGSTQAAEDVLQETFVAVAEAAGRYTPRGRFRNWLMRIVRNRCLNRLEAQRVRRAVVGGSALEVMDPAAGEPGPADVAETNEQHALLRSAVAALPDRQREAVALYAFEQMSYREIADVLDVPINTVKTLLHRGRANLARAMEPAEQESTREL